MNDEKTEKHGTIFRANGSIESILPKNGTDFQLDELCAVVGDCVDIKPLPGTKEVMVLNDNGKLEGLPENVVATGIWKKAYPIADYPVNNDELIVGDVLVCESGMIL